MFSARVNPLLVRCNAFFTQNKLDKYRGAQGLFGAFSDQRTREKHFSKGDQRENEEDFLFAEFADPLEKDTEDMYEKRLLEEYQKEKDLRTTKKDPHLSPALLKQVKTLHPFIEDLKRGNHKPDLDEEVVFTDADFTSVIKKLHFDQKDVNRTTLDLLKFPIVNPKPYRMFQRQKRLKEDFSKTEEDLSETELKQLKTLKKHSYVVGRVGRTSTKSQKMSKKDIEFDAELLSFSTEDDPEHGYLSENLREVNQFTYNELKDAHWFYDTPGIVKEGCVLNLLKDKEVKAALPTKAIIPRTFILSPGMTLFLAALGRIDFLQGERPAWFSVIASNLLPVHITSLDKADDIYTKHAGGTLLGVPIGGEERMKEFPPLLPQDIKLKGIGASRAVADIKLSTAGWIAVTAHSGEQLHLRCFTPKGTSLTIRQPPLLPLVVNIKGERLRKGPAYATKKPPCLVQNLK
eukprot:XP_017951975.1 PREDICTED: nitric oxide-associated protein 1 isoform X4 [Xenopus tropicalis]